MLIKALEKVIINGIIIDAGETYNGTAEELTDYISGGYVEVLEHDEKPEEDPEEDPADNQNEATDQEEDEEPEETPKEKQKTTRKTVRRTKKTGA